uniref:Uncharacterized protein n=1 Tax=Anguilla anguilla TaxID=7936 RepID=A0A0E9RCG7_ANGAN
MLVPASCV